MVTDELCMKINQTFLDLLAKHRWEDVTLSKIATTADVKLSDLREAFDGKVAMVEAFSRRIDAEVLDNIDPDISDELPRERLMDILLSRLDALMPHKEVIRTIMTAARKDLSLAAQLNRTSLVSMTWMLNGVEIDTSGIEGAVRVQGVSVVFARVIRVWLEDDESMAKTMTALDRELRAGERNIWRLNRLTSLLSPLKQMRRRHRARPATEPGEEGVAI